MTSEMKGGMGYIKVILLVNIGLTFAETNETRNYYKDSDVENVDQKDKDIHLSDGVYPNHYEVMLGVNTQSFYPRISVEGRIDINITVVPNATFQTLFLHGKNIMLDDYHTTLSNSKTLYFVDESSTEGEFLKIKFTTSVLPGNYILKLVFDSTANYSLFRYELSAKHTIHGIKNDLLLTHFGKIATQQLFPCWDDPAFKATFDISVKHETGYTILSNMPVLNNYNANHNMKWTKFDTTPKISTDQLVLLFKPFNLIDPRENVHTWHKSNKTSIISLFHNTVNNVSKFLEEYFVYSNLSLKNQKIDHVILPNAPYSEAHLGLIIYRESDVNYDENKDPISVKMNMVNTIEYQMARQWFGGLVTPKSWNHSWVTESFALYFSHYSTYKAEMCEYKPDCDGAYFEKLAQLKIVENYHDIMRKDNGSMPPVVFKINNISDILSLRSKSDVYHKGAFILRMLFGMFDKSFQGIVIRYFEKYKYGSITSDDLSSILNEMEYILNSNSHYPAGQKRINIKEMLNDWITQKNFPVLWASRNYKTNFVTISEVPLSKTYYKPEVEDFHNIGWDWMMPVTFMTENTSTIVHKQTWAFWWLTRSSNIEFELPIDVRWYLVNVQQIGYYRVHYDVTNWRNLGDYLRNSEDISKIHVLNRAQLIDDICDNFLKKYYRYTDWDLFWSITSYLNREADYIPWVTMLKCLDKMSIYFSLPESTNLQMYLAYYFNFILNELGYEENSNDTDITKKARQNLAFYACTLGNPTCRSVATEKLKKHLADPTNYTILPWWEHWTFCFGLKTENGSIWDQVYQLYVETKNKIILNYLPCTEDPNIIIKFLHKIENEELIEAKQTNIFNTIIKQHISNDQIFLHIKDNIMMLIPESMSLDDALDTFLTNIYSKKIIDDLYERSNRQVDDKIFTYLNKDKIVEQWRKVQILWHDYHEKLFPLNITSTYFT